MAAIGYGKIAGFMAKHAELATFQRFDFLNSLNILYLQAELVYLEKELKESMKADIESGNEPTARNPQDSNSIRSDTVAVGTGTISEKVVNANTNNAPTLEGNTGSVSDAESVTNGRVDGAEDWWFLSNSEHGQTWQIMLKTREKLKEYNEALLQQKEIKLSHSPRKGDLKFLRRWLKDEKTGGFPLDGDDQGLWETSSAEELVALKARKGEDPLGSLFLDKAFRWWHLFMRKCFGGRFKKPVDEESQYFKYEDKSILRVANVLASIISSSILVGSILALYFVKHTLVRLGIIAVLTQVFSLVLILATNARKAEMFAATAAFVAVQVVFVGSN